MNKKILIISFLGLIFGLFLLFNAFKFTTPAKSYQLYKQGLELSFKEDFQNAYYNFGKIGKNSRIYPLAIYRQAICAKELGDYSSAIKKYKKFAKIIKDDNLAPVALWEVGELYFGGRHYSSASKYFKMLQKKYPKSDFAYASNYRLGEISLKKNKPKLAQNYFLNYIEHAPMGRFSIPATENLNPSNLDDEQKLIFAISLYENKKYNKSLSVLNSISGDKKHYYVAKNYLALQKKDLAKEEFVKTLQTMQEEDGEKINDAILNYLTISGRSKSEDCAKLALLVKNPITIPGVLFVQAQNSSKEVAIANYNNVYKKSPNGYFAAESLWEIFWNYYKNKKYKEALKIAQIHGMKFENSNSAPKILYFSGKIHQKINSKMDADRFFKKVLDDYPDNYYAYRANEQLNREKYPFKTISNIPIKGEIKIPKMPIKSKYLSELLLMKDFEAIESFKIQDEFLKSWLLKAKGDISYSIVLARDEMAKLPQKPVVDDIKWQLVYPIYYSKTVNLMAENSSISPQLIMAILKEESFFYANAKSAVGALGLMQIMPQTAAFIEKEEYLPSKIYEPSYNIYLGSKYFASLKKQFGGNELFAVASYNGGPGNIIKWKNEFYNGDLDDFVENIPYVETQSYVKKIYGSYWNYLRIYGQ